MQVSDFNHGVQFTTLQLIAQVVRYSLSTEDWGFEAQILLHIWMYWILTYMLSRQLDVRILNMPCVSELWAVEPFPACVKLAQ